MQRTLRGFLAGLALVVACAHDEGTSPDSPADSPPPDGGPAFSSGTTPPDAPNPVNPNFVWGVNGHPTSEDGYSLKSTAERQFNLLKSLGAGWYRIDVHPDDSGYVAPRSPDGNDWNLSQVFDSAAQYEINILPVLILVPGTELPCRMNDTTGCYTLGYERANKFVLRYNGRFTHIEAGNELGDFAIDTGVSGTEVQHYPMNKLMPVAKLIQGMIDGIRSANPSIKILVNSLNRHYAFFQALENVSVSDFDITGYHWYETTDLFDPYYNALAAQSNRDIWIGEFNRMEPSDPDDPADEEAQALKILADARKYYGKPRVKAAFVFELFEVDGQSRGRWGLLKCGTFTHCQGDLTEKPGFDNYAFAVEEQLYSHEDYVHSLIIRMNRIPSPAASSVTYWRDRFRQSNSKATLLDEFLPDKSYELFVRDQYLSLLDSGSPPSEDVAYWVTQMRSGYPREQVISSLCGTTLFWNLAGSTNGGFVDRLYRRLLDSEPDSSDRAYWVHRLETGASTRVQVADALLHTTAYFTRFVEAQWIAVLDQTANSTERSFWVSQMQAGTPQIGVIRALLYSVSFWNPAIWAGYVRRH